MYYTPLDAVRLNQCGKSLEEKWRQEPARIWNVKQFM